MSKNFVIMFGPQGSGKSTQAKLLAEKLCYKFISSGDLLRKLKEEHNPIGEKLSEYWIKGELVPDRIIEDILYTVFERENTQGFVMDGFPRDKIQLESFLGECRTKGWNILKVVFLKLTEDQCVERLKIREKIEHRADETEEAIRKRFQIYHNETELLIPVYKQMGLLLELDGNKEINQVHDEIIANFAQYIKQ